MLKISKTLELPTDFATQTVAILARKRVGKTYTASVIAEECCENKIPFVALDPTGAWWGLRSEYPVIIIGGSHGDIPLEFTAGKTLAEFIVENPGYYVLDLSGSESDAEQDRFATAFAQRLYRLKEKHREPLHLFVDEADSFAPQRPMPGQQTMLGAFEAIVRRGGIRGLGITMITQRAAVINKNVLTQCEVIIALQTTGPQDIKAIEEWIKLNATEDQRKEFLSSVASLGIGEAWVWSPTWLDIFKRVQIRERRTFNSSATPKVGEKKAEPKALAAVDLASLREKMSATIEQVKANDPKTLKAEIVKLKAEIAKRPTPEIKTEVQTVEVFPASALKAFNNLLAVDLNGVRVAANNALKFCDDIEFRVNTILQQTPQENAPIAPKPTPTLVFPAKPIVFNGAFQPNKKQQEILDAVAWWESIGIKSPSGIQVGAVALVDPTGGYFSNMVGPLVTNGLIERSSGQIRLTDAGRAVAAIPEQGSTLSEYHDVLRSRIRKMKSANGRTVDILNAVVNYRGRPITTEEIGQQVGIDPSGGYFSNTIGPLSTAGLITRGGGIVTPTNVLFPEGLS